MITIYLLRLTLRSTRLGLSRQRKDMVLLPSPCPINGWFHQRQQGGKYSTPLREVLGKFYTHNCHVDLKKMIERWGTTGCSKMYSATQCRQVLFPKERIYMIKLTWMSLVGQGCTKWKRRDIRMKPCLYSSRDMVCHQRWWWTDQMSRPLDFQEEMPRGGFPHKADRYIFSMAIIGWGKYQGAEKGSWHEDGMSWCT